MLKLAVISHMYPSVVLPTNGIFVHEHVKALMKLGVNVRVVAPVPWTPPGLRRLKGKWSDYSAIAGGEKHYDGVNVIRPVYLTPPHPLDCAGGWSMATQLRWSWKTLMSEFECDAIHAHAITPDGFAACKLANWLRLPVICSARGSEVHTTPRESAVIRGMTRWTLRHSDGVIAVSRALAQDATEVACENVIPRVIYNGVANSFRATGDSTVVRTHLNFSTTARIILFVGRCEWDKGVGELLQAFGEFSSREPLAELVLVGNGGARQELEHAACLEKFGSQIRFTGQVGRKDISQYLRAADIFVLPSYGEGMPNALLEAMAAALPCIATAVGGIPEAIQDGVNGLLIPPKSPGAIVTALERINAAPDFAKQLGSAAAQTVKDKFVWEANARAHLAFYEEIIARFHDHT